jgi:hypothetical protein
MLIFIGITLRNRLQGCIEVERYWSDLLPVKQLSKVMRLFIAVLLLVKCKTTQHENFDFTDLRDFVYSGYG